ncbi:hypothetical protein HYE67_006613 [Fusarium culmorum]|uniref:CBM-cenC domain-containing protein n=1 Tax=Fusarium culmorum TaxID=5516 RepID=A0A7S8D9B5_FUSCU|nr:hypothetical protein HYE67_006613 [Fusarium culmorum]
MGICNSLTVALAFGIAAVHAGPCKSVTLSHDVPSSTISMSTIDASNLPSSPIISAATRTTSLPKRSITTTTKILSATTTHTRNTKAVPASKHTATSTRTSKPKATAINLLGNPGFDDPTNIFFSQPWVLRSVKGKSIAELKDSHHVKSKPTALYMSITEGGVPSMEQWVAGLEKSKKYTLSTWVAYESGTGGCHIDLKLGKTLVKRHVISKTSPGRYKKVEGVVSSKFQMDLVSMWLYCPSETTVAILVDNFSLKEVMQ